MKDYLSAQGVQNLFGPKNASKEAFRLGLITNGNLWAAMIVDRNRSVHTYNESTAKEIADNILTRYYPLLGEFQQKMTSLIE